MGRKLPLKWFPAYTAQIYLKKVDKWAETWAKNGVHPYFDTWEEARDFMIERAVGKIKRLKRELASEERHLAKVLTLIRPEDEEPKE
jgi:hypothetical protein